MDDLAWAERVVVVAEALQARLPGRPRLAARLLDGCLQPEPPLAASQPLAPADPWPASSATATDDPEDRGKENETSAAATEGIAQQSGKGGQDVVSPSARGGVAVGKRSREEAGEQNGGVEVREAGDKALLVALMQRQPVSAEDLLDSASSQQESVSESSSRAAPMRRDSSASEAGTEDWDAALQTVRLLQCQYGAGRGSDEGHAADMGKGKVGGGGVEGPQLVHQLYARLRPGELRIATVAVMES